MAGFRYLTVAGSSTDRFRQYLSLAGPERRSKLVTIDIDYGFTGAIAVTGVGFEPEAVMAYDVQLAGDHFEFAGRLHCGFAAGNPASPDQWATAVYWPHLDSGGVPRYRRGKHSDAKFILSALNGIEADMLTFDADGFTIDVTRAPVDDTSGPSYGYITVAFLAITGEGSYHVGTDKSPTSAGVQTITGLGFDPELMMFASVQRYDETNPGDWLSESTEYARICLGGADPDGQWNVWAGALSSGDPYSSQVSQSGAVLSLWQDADGGGPFQPAILAEATVTFIADGFELDWTSVVPDEFYFSWFATDGFSQAGRWTYNHPSGVVGRVGTRKKPKALIFYSGDIALDGSQGQGTSGSATMGLGAAGQRAKFDGSDQAAISFMDIDTVAFFIPQADREMNTNAAFGCYERRQGSTPPNNMQDVGIVRPYGRDHLLRLHVGQ